MTEPQRDDAELTDDELIARVEEVLGKADGGKG